MAKLIKSTSDVKPEIMTVYYNEDNIPVYASINLNIVENENMYYWDELVLPDFALENIHNAPNDVKYGVLVAHVIKAYYDDNKMTAILSNYLLDMTDEDHKKEFDTLQNLRKTAKEVSKYIIANSLF